jgi:hypothetical protein
VHWCEISLTLREEYRFRMSVNRVLRRIFGLHIEEGHSSLEKIA